MATYVISDIHGAYDAYQKLKEKAGYDKAHDQLYIIGDVLDGNNRHPEDALRILDEVMTDDSITLLLGNHELVHLEYYKNLCTGRRKAADMWRDYLCDPLCGGQSLLEYLSGHPKEQATYMNYLSKCPIMQLVADHGKLYYLVHGAPIPYRSDLSDHDALWNWIFASVEQTPDFKENLILCLLHHPALNMDETVTKEDLRGIVPENLYCIVGHTPTKYIHPPKDKSQRMYYKNHIYDIDCGCRANTLGKPMSSQGLIDIKSSLCMMRLGETVKCFYVP